MAQVLIRDLDPDTVEALRERARRNGRSLEAELRQILGEAAHRSRSDFWLAAERLRKRTRGRQRTDSTELIRSDRDR